MDSAFHNLDAALFMDIWRHFDRDDKGYVDRKMLEDFFRHTMKKLGVRVTEEKVQQMKHRFASTCDGGGHERLQIQELASKMLPEDENFLLLFRREEALESSVEFMRIWRNYDTDSSGYISAVELKDFLKDLFLQHNKVVSPGQLEKYTEAMMKMFDKNNDGRLDLNDLARQKGAVIMRKFEEADRIGIPEKDLSFARKLPAEIQDGCLQSRGQEARL
nr:secretagogin-like isoform X3 [Paramormyrops kingsleyae]